MRKGPRGLVKCPYGYVMHADVNAALNILKRAGGKPPERVRVLSFTPTANGVISGKKRERGSPITLRLRRGNGVARTR